MKKRILSLSAMAIGATMLVTLSIPVVQTHVSAGQRGDFITNSEGDTIISYEGTGGNVTIPDGIEIIGAGAFKDSKVTNVDLNDVKVIGNSAFSDSPLSSVTGLGGVSTIGGEAFARTTIEAFDVPKSLTRLAGDAFDGDEKLTGFSGGSTLYPVYGGCVYSDRGKTLFIVPRGLKDSVTVWKKAETIAPGALKECNRVTDIYIPATIKQIGIFEEAAGFERIAALPAKSTVYGYKGSVAQKYAKRNGVKFVSVGEVDGAAAEAEAIAFDNEYNEIDPSETVEMGIDPDEQILQASANGTVETTESYPVETNVPVTIAENGGSGVVVEPKSSKTNNKSGSSSSSSSVVYSAGSSSGWTNNSDTVTYYDYNSANNSNSSNSYDFDYYDEFANAPAYSSSSRAGEVAARIVVPDETPISSNTDSGQANNSTSSGTSTTDTLPVEGGQDSNSSGSQGQNTVNNNTNNSVNSTVSDNGSNSTSNTVSDNGQGGNTAYIVADNGQQNTNQQATSENTANLAARALDATPKTADLSIGAPFIFAAGLFMAGFSGMILTRRRKVPALSIEYETSNDELD